MEQIIRKKVNDMQSFYKTFDTEKEAMKMAEFFNRQVERTESNRDYTFEVRKFSEDELRNLEGMNEYLEKDLININPEGYYIAGINSNEKVTIGKKKLINFKSFGIFQNENSDLVFTDLSLNRKTVGDNLDKRYSLSDIGRASFVLPNPLSQSPIISTLNDKVKIVNQVIRRNPSGQQNIYNADYRSVAINLIEHVRNSYFNANTHGKEGDSFNFAYAMSYANRHYTGITGKSTTDFMSMNKIDGTEGMNLHSTGSFSFEKYIVGREDLINLFDDDGTKILHNGKPMTKNAYMLEETSKYSNFEFSFNRKGELEGVNMIGFKDGKRFESALNSSIVRDVSSKGRFLELFNDKMSQINQHSKHHENAMETIKSLNNSLDIAKKLKTSRTETVDELLRIINKSYGADVNLLGELTKDGGILSRQNLGLFVDNGYRFNAFLDVNRQSINTENAVTTMSGAIFDALGSFNKYGQRHAQSDAKMSKAIINVGGTDFNLSEEAKMWSSGLEEHQYKKIHFENGHGKRLIEEAQEILYGSKLSSEYMSQQNYMLYAYHNGAFQDSNVISTDLALENISKFDSKDTMHIPFNAMTSKVTGGEVVDYSKLNSANAYVDGTIENRMFRTLIGEENYKRHLVSNETLIDDYRAIGSHMEGIKNLQSIEDRKAYATANDNMLGDVNRFLKKHMLEADAKARVEIINKEAVNPGQFRHLTGVNHAYISGVDFNEKGILIKTNGIVTNGDSTKAMANEVKFTVQSIMPSLGIVNDNGYIPISGMNNEKILSKKRGFTGTLLERSINTLAFNYMTMGNSDSLEENFDVWKKAMTEQYVVDGVGGKKVNLFDALGIDMTYENGTMKFINNVTNEALASYNFKSKGLVSSVNLGIQEHMAQRVMENFGFSLNDKTGSKFTEKLFTILSSAEDGLKNTIVGSKGNLSEEQRRNLASIFVKGNLEAINITKSGPMDTNLGEVRGLRLINNIHMMQETKSRADKEGLSIGRLSALVLRESGMFELADNLEEKISFDGRKTMEKYLALSGALEDYSDSSIPGSRANAIFSGNILDLKDKTIRYNIFGTNTTVNNYMNVSPFGDIIKANYDFDGGALKDIVYGKIVGFSNDFLDVAGKMSGDKRNVYVSNALKSIAFSDFSSVMKTYGSDELGVKKIIIDSLKSERIASKFSKISMFAEEVNAVESAVAGTRAKMLQNLINQESVSYEKIIKGIGFEGLGKIKKDEMINLLDFYLEQENSGLLGDRALIGLVSEKMSNKTLGFQTNTTNARTLFNFLNKHSVAARATAAGEFSKNTNSYGMLERLNAVSLDASTQMGANRILNALFESELDNNFDSEHNISKMLLSRFSDYTGKNVFNLNELEKIAKNNSFNFLIDELAADESGVIISKTSLTEVEKMVRLNQELNEIDAAINVTNSDERAKTIGKFKEKLKQIGSKLTSKEAFEEAFPGMGREEAKAIRRILNESELKADDILRSSYYDFETLKKLPLDDRLSIVYGMTFEKDLSSALNVPKDHKKIIKIRELNEESLNILKGKISAIRENAVRLPNNSVGLANAEGETLKAYGKTLDNFYENLTNGSITTISGVSAEIKKINSMIEATKGSNIYNDQMNVMLNERDLIRKLVGESVDHFIGTAVGYNAEAFKSYDSIINAMDEIANTDISEANILDTLFKIDDDVRLKRAEGDNDGLALLELGIKKIKNVNRHTTRLEDLNAKKGNLIQRIINSTVKVHSDLGENFFRKGGALEKMSTTRFKNSVEFSPKEGTIITDYIMAELDSVLESGSTKSKGELFASLRTLYGDAVVDDMYSDFEIAFKKKKLEPFKVELKARLENLSGVVLGDHQTFKNAGLEKIVEGTSDTVVKYGLLSRNPHQYQGSLRSTRYVALSEEDKNRSFFARMFGSRNSLDGTQANLYLVGKRTAIAAHGDFDGDKFQALFMDAKDFYFKGKDGAIDFSNRNENMFKLYQLTADYEGNLEVSIKKKKLNNVEKEILSLGRKAYGMEENSYNKNVFKKIEHLLHVQKAEMLRTKSEVLGENASHAEISFFKLLKSKKSVGVDEFSKVYGELDDQSKLMFLTNRMTVEDLKNFDKFFSPEMLENKEFLEKINKIKAVADERDIAIRVLEEFGEDFGAKGKIAWNNATLAESSYAAYTGINRTGTVHYSLTSLRDSAAVLWSSDAREMLKENFKAGGDQTLAKSLDTMIDEYTSAARFVNPLNTIDELIDKLAISSKVSDGSSPYERLKYFERTADALYENIFEIMHTNKEQLNKFINFKGLENASKFLLANHSENFDVEKFKEATGVENIADLFGNKKLKRITEEFVTKELAGKSKILNYAEVNNLDLAKTIGNLYAFIGKGVLGTAASTRSLSSGAAEMVENPYGQMRSAVYKKNQNFFHAMNMIFNRNIDEDGYNFNTRVFGGYRKIFNSGATFIKNKIKKKPEGGEPPVGANQADEVKQVNEVEVNNLNIERQIDEINELNLETDEIINNVINPGITEQVDQVKFQNASMEQIPLDFTETSSSQVEKQIINSNNEIVTNLEARIAELEQELAKKQEPVLDNSRIDEIVSQYEEKIHTAQEGNRTNQAYLANKIDELEKEIKTKEIEMEKMARKHENAINNLNGAHSKSSEFNSTKATKSAEKMSREHEKTINNLNAAHEKNAEFNKKKIADLESELEAVKGKAEGYIAQIKNLSQENQTIKGTINNSSAKSHTIKESADIVYNDLKNLYNKHSKITIAAGATAILGVAISMLQGSRPVVDLDINDEQYEKSQGSIYRNLGNYSINTNIRSIR